MTYSTYASNVPHVAPRPGDQQPFSNPNTWDQSMEESIEIMDLNEAEPQGRTFDLIPPGTILRVRLEIKPGDPKDLFPEWRNGYATGNPKTGSVYLKCEYTVCEEGPHQGHKIWGLIGLHSPNGPKWKGMGQSFMRSILESAYGIASDDQSERAQGIRRLKHYGQLNGLQFVARVDVQKDPKTDKLQNVIKTAITKGHKDYDRHSGYGAGISAAPVSQVNR